MGSKVLTSSRILILIYRKWLCFANSSSSSNADSKFFSLQINSANRTHELFSGLNPISTNTNESIAALSTIPAIHRLTSNSFEIAKCCPASNLVSLLPFSVHLLDTRNSAQSCNLLCSAVYPHKEIFPASQ